MRLLQRIAAVVVAASLAMAFPVSQALACACGVACASNAGTGPEKEQCLVPPVETAVTEPGGPLCCAGSEQEPAAPGAPAQTPPQMNSALTMMCGCLHPAPNESVAAAPAAPIPHDEGLTPSEASPLYAADEPCSSRGAGGGQDCPAMPRTPPQFLENCAFLC